jgi:iron complex transport system substrate-binding protein
MSRRLRRDVNVRSNLTTPALLSLLIGLVLLTGCPREEPTAPSPTNAPMIEQPDPAEDTPSDWPRTFTDAMGEEVTLQAPPERVISLSTGFTEAIFAMGAEDRLVGRVNFANYPPEAQDVPSVGGVIDPSLEAIVEQEPDLVVTVRGTPRDVVASIRRAGIPVIARDPTSVDEVLGCIRDLGRYLDVEEDANDLADDLRERAEAVAEEGHALATGQGRPSVLFIVGLDPVYVAGEGHFVDDMISTAGGLNASTLVDGTNGGQWQSFSMEAVVEVNPDIIVVAMMHEDEWAAVDPDEVFAGKAGWKDLSAVQGGRVYKINPDIALRAGPRLVDALEQMGEITRDAVGGGAAAGG